jgi:uncharacterized delta-60 repeat protein
VIVAPTGYAGGYVDVIYPNHLSLPNLAGLQVVWSNNNNSTQTFTLGQYTAGGKADTTFGNAGYISFSTEGYFYTGNLEYASDGSFVVETKTNGVSSAQHFTKAGQPDLGFGSDTLGTDSLVGGAGDDTLVSGPAVATLDGGAGNNTYLVNNSTVLVRQSTLNGDTGTVYTSVSYDLSKQAVNIATLVSTSVGGVTLKGNALANSIIGGLGNDTIYAGAGDTVTGGGGRDLYIVTDASAQVIGNTLGGDTLQSSTSYDLSQAENINNLLYTGTLGASLTGNGVTGSIIGGAGNDTLGDGIDPTGSMSGGSVTLIGGAGVNTYIVNSINDTIIDSGKGGVLMSSIAFDLSLPQAGGFNNLTYIGTSPAVLNGNGSANQIVDMTTLGNTLVGGSGSDTLVAGSGGDLLFAGNATFDLGLILAPNGVTFAGDATPTSLSDGSVLVTGSLAGGQLAAFHYTKAGLLDTAFGTGGYVVQPEGFTVDTLMGLSSGKILAGGTDSLGAGFAAQYTATGQLDTTFGNNGVITGIVSMLADGSYLTTMSGGLAHYTAAGKADTVNGAATTGVLKVPTGYTTESFQQSFADGSFIVSGSDASNNPVAIHYLAGGKLDTAYATPGNPYYLADGSFLADAGNGLAHFKANGQPDTVNGSAATGVLKAPNSGYTVGSIQQDFADGSFIVSGADSGNNLVTIHYLAGAKLDAAYVTPSNPYYLSDGSFLADAGNGLARFKANGQADTTVGVNGVLKLPSATLNDGGISSVVVGSLSDIAFTLSDGSYLFNGTDPVGNQALVHYSKTFVLDTAFGSGGAQTGPIGLVVESVNLSGGKYKLVGTLGSEPYYAQYTATGQLDTTFGNGGVLTAPAGDIIQGVSTLSGGGFLATITDANGNTTFARYSASGQLDLGFGSDTLGADSLVGGAGDDTLVSSSGLATLDGGTGNNTFYVNNSSVVVRQSTLNSDTGTVYSSVSYDLSKQAPNVATLVSTSATGVILKGNALVDSIVGSVGNDTITAGTGGGTLQAFGQHGGVQQGSSFEADLMTGGVGADSFVLGDSSGCFYLDSGIYTSGDASYAGINNFDLTKDQLVLFGSAGDYSAAFFQDYKANITGSDLVAFNKEIQAFTALTGITPSNKDIMLYHGDISAGGADFIAGIHTTTTLGLASDILNHVTIA